MTGTASTLPLCDICGEQGELINGVCEKHECRKKAQMETVQYLPAKVAATLKSKFRDRKNRR